MATTLLPSPIILNIMFNSDVNTLKSLRQVSRTFCNLTQAYGHSLKSSLLSRFHSAEIRTPFTSASIIDDPILALLRINYRITLARWIAALAVKECIIMSSNLHEDRRETLGDKYIPPQTMLRYVTTGLGIMWQLFDIACNTTHENSTLPHFDPTASIPTIRDPSSTLLLERHILQQQIQHLAGLSHTGKASLYFAFEYCIRYVSRERAFEIDDEGGQPYLCQDAHLQRELWVHWFILREGPSFIAAAWTSSADNERCTKLVAAQLLSRNANQRTIEQEAAHVFFLSLHRLITYDACVICNSPLEYVVVVAESEVETVLEDWTIEGGLQGDAVNQVALPLGQPAIHMVHSLRRPCKDVCSDTHLRRTVPEL